MKKCTICGWKGEDGEVRLQTDGISKTGTLGCPSCRGIVIDDSVITKVTKKDAGSLDVNKDGKVDEKDAIAFVKKVFGKKKGKKR